MIKNRKLNDLLLGSSRCRQNFKFGNFTLLCGRLSQRILPKCVPHVRHVSSFNQSINQSDHCFLALCLSYSIWAELFRSPR